MSDEIMTREKVVSIKRFSLVEDAPEPDNLGEGTMYIIKINAMEDFKRGLLMMSAGNNFFVPATREGALTAKELCILAEDMGVEVEEKEADGETETDEYTTAIAYFDGQLSGAKIILDYETENDNHTELLEELSEKFRQQKFNIL